MNTAPSWWNQFKSALGIAGRPWWAGEEPGADDRGEPGTVFDKQRQPLTLGPLLNSGGEGRIYPCATDGGLVVKIYNPQLLTADARAAQRQGKLAAMQTLTALAGHPRMAWPRAPIFDAAGHWLGFSMPRFAGHSLHTFGAPALVRERYRGWDRRQLTQLGLQLIVAGQFIERQGARVGDVNPGNFLVDPAQPRLAAIDCDSYQVEACGRQFLCEGKVDAYTPPEMMDADLHRVPRGSAQERFAFAVLLFQVLMLGQHPYSCRQGEDPALNLRRGTCPLGLGTGLQLPAGPWYNIWSYFPYSLKSVFCRMFRDGHARPDRRPSWDEAQTALEEYLHLMERSWLPRALMPDRPRQHSRYRPQRQPHPATGKWRR